MNGSMWQGPETSFETLKQIVGANDSLLVIPKYQRPYAWEQKQLQDLWSDLERMRGSDENSHYLMGTITMRKEEMIPPIKPLYEYYHDLAVFPEDVECSAAPRELPKVDENMDEEEEDAERMDVAQVGGGDGQGVLQEGEQSGSIISIAGSYVSTYFQTSPSAVVPPVAVAKPRVPKRSKLVRERLESKRHLISRSLDTVHCYSVIDGQQRLTTLFVMLRAIYEQFGTVHEDEQHTRYTIMQKYLFLPLHSCYDRRYVEKLVLANDTHPFFVRMLLGLHSKKPKTKYEAESRLFNALQFFRRKLQHKRQEIYQEYEGMQEYHYSLYLQELLIKVTQRLHFNIVTLKRDTVDAHVLFEVNNCRGTHLTTLELVKNRMMYVASRMHNDVLTERIHETWSDVYRLLMHSELGKREDEEQLLYNMWQTFHTNKVGSGRKVYDEICQEFNPDVVVSGEQCEELCQRVYTYLSRLTCCCKDYCNLYSPFREDVLLDAWVDEAHRYELQEAIVNMHRIGSLGMFVPLLMGAIHQDQLALAGGELALRMLRLCEKYVMCVYRVASTRNDAGKNDILRLGGQLGLNQCSIDVACAALKERIQRHCPVTTLRRFFLSRTRQFTEWSAVRHFLVQYEVAHNPETPVQYNDVTVEHVLPQQFRDGPYWLNKFGGEEKCESFVHRLGNLTLSHSTWNSSYGNKSFHEKRDGNPKGYARSALFIENELARSEHWTPDEVIKRQERLTEWAIKRFHL